MSSCIERQKTDLSFHGAIYKIDQKEATRSILAADIVKYLYILWLIWHHQMMLSVRKCIEEWWGNETTETRAYLYQKLKVEKEFFFHGAIHRSLLSAVHEPSQWTALHKMWKLELHCFKTGRFQSSGPGASQYLFQLWEQAVRQISQVLNSSTEKFFSYFRSFQRKEMPANSGSAGGNGETHPSLNHNDSRRLFL